MAANLLHPLEMKKSHLSIKPVDKIFRKFCKFCKILTPRGKKFLLIMCTCLVIKGVQSFIHTYSQVFFISSPILASSFSHFPKNVVRFCDKRVPRLSSPRSPWTRTDPTVRVITFRNFSKMEIYKILFFYQTIFLQRRGLHSPPSTRIGQEVTV